MAFSFGKAGLRGDLFGGLTAGVVLSMGLIIHQLIGQASFKVWPDDEAPPRAWPR